MDQKTIPASAVLRLELAKALGAARVAGVVNAGARAAVPVLESFDAYIVATEARVRALEENAKAKK